MIPEGIAKQIRDHARQEMPRESCGLIVVVKGRRRYVPCKNIASIGDFAICPEDYAAAEDMGEVVAVVHSHVNISPKPSQADLVGCERSGLEWIIVCANTGEIYSFSPKGYTPPLIGRVFHHGITDCYTFIRDYYKQILQIDLPDFERRDNWWLGGENLYIDNFAKAGFSIVDKPQKHDVILMKVAAPVVNHGAVYVGDGKIEHHQMNRLSSRDMYGGWYQKITTHFLRHEDLT